MQTLFTDLVGTTVVPACIPGADELTDLTPALVSETDALTMTAGGPQFCPYVSAARDIVNEASEAGPSAMAMAITWVSGAQADLSQQASETAISRPGTVCCL